MQALAYLIQRKARHFDITYEGGLEQTVWALTTQIRRGSVVPERSEFSFYESPDMANDVTVEYKGIASGPGLTHIRMRAGFL